MIQIKVLCWSNAARHPIWLCAFVQRRESNYYMDVVDDLKRVAQTHNFELGGRVEIG